MSPKWPRFQISEQPTVGSRHQLVLSREVNIPDRMELYMVLGHIKNHGYGCWSPPRCGVVGSSGTYLVHHTHASVMSAKKTHAK